MSSNTITITTLYSCVSYYSLLLLLNPLKKIMMKYFLHFIFALSSSLLSSSTNNFIRIHNK